MTLFQIQSEQEEKKEKKRKVEFRSRRGQLSKYCKRAHKILGRHVESPFWMPDFGPVLRQADIPINTGAYASAVLLTMGIGLVASVVGLLVIGSIIGLPVIVVLSPVSIPIVFIAFYMYPTYRASGRKANIDENLPFAVASMATLAGSGANTLDMFRTIAHGNRYGEMSREALKIVSDVENLGYTIRSAMERAIERTPSANLRALLYNMISTMISGGDLKSLLLQQAEKVIDETKRRQEEALDALGMVSEAYSVILILGPVLALIMSVIMTMLLPSMATMMKLLQYGLLMLIPIGYAVFAIMTSAIKPNL